MRVNIGDVIECFKANNTALNRDLRIDKKYYPSDFIFLFSEYQATNERRVFDITANKNENCISIFLNKTMYHHKSLVYFEKNFYEDYPTAFEKYLKWSRLQKLSHFAFNT